MITHTVLGTKAQVFLLLCCVFFHTAEHIYFCKVANFNVMETMNVLTMYAHDKAQKYKFVLQNLWSCRQADSFTQI